MNATFRIDTIELEEFGGQEFHVRAWSGADQAAFHTKWQELEHDGLIMAAAVASSIVDANGHKRYDMNGDIQEIAESWPMSALEKVWGIVQRQNKLTRESREAQEKN